MKSRYPCQEHASKTSRPAEVHIFHHTVMLRWKPTRRKRRQYILYTVTAIFFLLLFTFHNNMSIGPSPYSGRWTALHQPAQSPLIDKHVALWKSLHSLVRNNNPQCRKKPDLLLDHDVSISFDPAHNHPRPDLLWLDEADVTRLRSAHANFVSDIRSHDLHLAYEPGTRGIVTLASESFLPALTVSLRMLRKTSSTLPVDIFLRSPSPESHAFCTSVFYSLDAKCIYLSDVFAAADTPISPTMQQSKILAILFSTFEEVLFLEPCSFPITAPEPLFHAVPFADTGLVLWPDFWYRSESPYYFDLAKVLSIPPLSARAASQSNAVMYSKPKHPSALMLAAYYNFYGPDYYYLLQSQGGPGAGDKETYGLAADALDEPAYYVSRPVQSLGRHDNNGNWIGTGMAQYDPIADFYVQAHNRVPVVQPEAIANPLQEKQRANANIRPMFVHADHTQFDPRIVLPDNLSTGESAVSDKTEKGIRSWMSEIDAIALFGFDVEKRYWAEIEKSTCGDLLGLWLEEGLPDKRAQELVKRRDGQLCARVRKYNEEAFGGDKA